MPLIAIPAGYWAVGGLIAAVGATIAWQQSGGPEATAQAMSDLADSLTGAEDDAASQTGATATTCIGDCRPTDPECAALYDEIATLTRELAGRRADMLRDMPTSEGGLGMFELFQRDPYAVVPDPRGKRPHLGNWDGHSRQILQKQRNLQRKIAQYRAKPCTPLPPGAETQAYQPPPTLPLYL